MQKKSANPVRICEKCLPELQVAARGVWQRLNGADEAPLCDLRGRARRYAGRYSVSLTNLVERLPGWHFRLGPRGGWTGRSICCPHHVCDDRCQEAI